MIFKNYQTVRVSRLCSNKFGSRDTALVVPGWSELGAGTYHHPGQFWPLVKIGSQSGILDEYRYVYTVDFVGSHAVFPQTAIDMADAIRTLRKNKDHGKLTLIGETFGAAVLVYALGQIESFRGEQVLLINPPAGVWSLVDVNQSGAVGRWAAQRCTRLPELLNIRPIQRLCEQVLSSIRAYDGQIEVPPGTSHPERYEKMMRRAVTEGRRAIPCTRILEQLGVMARLHRDDDYRAACMHITEQMERNFDFRVIMLLGTRGDSMVDPEVVSEFYRYNMPGVPIWGVESGDCDMLLRPTFWSQALREALY